MIASSLDALGPVVLDGFTCDRELGESLKASANVPEIAGPPRTVSGCMRGRWLADWRQLLVMQCIDMLVGLDILNFVAPDWHMNKPGMH